MKVKMFMENMWEFSLCFYFVTYKVNIPMYAGEFFLCYFFVPYKVNIPMYAEGFKQVQYKEYICWMQVKIHISDQTSLRICNSAAAQQIMSNSLGSLVLCTVEGDVKNQQLYSRSDFTLHGS
jgi:hypothetical protein